MMRPGDDFEGGLDRIVRALDTDLDAVREQTRIFVRARAWELAGRRASPLLRGDELRAAEDWLSRAASAGIRPTELHIQFIRESRRVAVRRQRTTAVVSAAVASLAIALSIFALSERATAVQQAGIARSDGLSAEAANEPAYGARVAALLALEAYRSSPTPQARSALVDAIETPLLGTRFPGVGPLAAVAVSPRGDLVAAGGDDGIAIWSPGGARGVSRIRTGSSVNGVAFSPDGSLIAAALTNGRLAIYKVAGHALAYRFTGDGTSANAVAFDPAEIAKPIVAFVTAGHQAGGHVFLHALVPGAETQALVRGTALVAAAFSGDGTELAVGGADNATGRGTVLVSSLGGVSLSRTFAVGDGALGLAFSPSGSQLAAAGADGDLYLLDPRTGARRVVPTGSAIESVAFNPSGSLVAVGGDGGVVDLLNASTASQVGEPIDMGSGSIVTGTAFDDHGDELISAASDGTVMSWAASGLTLQRSVATFPRTAGIHQLAVNHAGTLLASANANFSATIWRLPGFGAIHQLSDSSQRLTAVGFEPSGNILGVGLYDGAVALENAASGTPAGSLTPPRSQPASPVVDVDFGAGARAAAGDLDGDVDLWSVAGGHARLLARLTEDLGKQVTAMAFDRSGSQVAVTYLDGGVNVFSLTREPPVATHLAGGQTLWSVAFVDGGTEVAAGDDEGAVEIFNARSGALVATLPGAGQPVYGLALSPDGKTLATTDGGGRLRLWDLAGGNELGHPLLTGTGALWAAFAPDGGALFTGDKSGAIDDFAPLLWSQGTTAFARYLCPRTGSNLTQSEWSQLVPGESYHATCP